jgi:hypothetical protein
MNYIVVHMPELLSLKEVNLIKLFSYTPLEKSIYIFLSSEYLLLSLVFFIKLNTISYYKK